MGLPPLPAPGEPCPLAQEEVVEINRAGEEGSPGVEGGGVGRQRWGSAEGGRRYVLRLGGGHQRTQERGKGTAGAEAREEARKQAVMEKQISCERVLGRDRPTAKVFRGSGGRAE